MDGLARRKYNVDGLASKKTTWTDLPAEKRHGRACPQKNEMACAQHAAAYIFDKHKLMSSYDFYPQNILLRKGQTDQTRQQFVNEYLVGYM